MIYKSNIFYNSSLLILSFLLLVNCGGGGGGGSSGSSVSSSYGGSSCVYSCSDTSNSNGSSFASETSSSYDASTASTWAAREEFGDILYTSSYEGVTSTQNPYEVMNVHKAYGYDLSGDGIYIHVQDNAFDKDHHEFTDKTVTLYQTNYTSDTTSSYHANSVAGIALGDYNSNTSGSPMGVAYMADLYFSDYNTLKSGSDYAADWSSALDDAPAATAASNHSYGITADIETVKTYQSDNSLSDAATIEAYMDAAGLTSTTSGASDFIASLKSFQANKGVIVWALGNHSDQSWDTDKVHFLAALPELDSDLKGAWITAATVDIEGSSGNETYHNRYQNCGITASYCLSTDSYGIVVAAYENVNSGTVDSDGSSSYYYTGGTSGNSFSAPMISGSVALLTEAFSSLTPKEIAARLLATADNTWFTSDGTTEFSNGVKHGFNFRFGHGIPDLYQALQPITSNMLGNSILVGDNIESSQAFDLEDTSLSLGSAFGDSLNNAINNEVGVFHDALYGTFNYDFSKSVNSKTNEKPKQEILSLKESISYEKTYEQKLLGFNTNIITATSSNKSFNKEQDLLSRGFSFVSQIGDDKEFFTSHRIPLEVSMGFVDIENSNSHIINNTGFAIPFIQESRNNLSYGSTIFRDENKSVSFGYFNTNDDLPIKKDAYVSSVSFDHKDSKNSLMIGISNEQESFLSTNGGGAFNLDSHVSPTKFVAYSNNQRLSENTNLFFTSSYGFTEVNLPENRLISDIGNVTSSSFGISFIKNKLSSEKDKLTLFLSQPHRIESGSANLLVPKGRDKQKNLYFENKEVSLSPSGRQLDLSIGYDRQISKNSQLSVESILTQNYNHSQKNLIDNKFVVSFILSF